MTENGRIIHPYTMAQTPENKRKSPYHKKPGSQLLELKKNATTGGRWVKRRCLKKSESSSTGNFNEYWIIFHALSNHQCILQQLDGHKTDTIRIHKYIQVFLLFFAQTRRIHGHIRVIK